MVPVASESDPEKATSNLHKQGVSVADAITGFADEFALTIEDNVSDQPRFIMPGADAFGELLVVSMRGDVRRVSGSSPLAMPSAKNAPGMKGKRE